MFHSKEKFKGFIIEWFKSAQDSIRRGDQLQIKFCTEKQETNANQYDGSHAVH